jgi:hypothetical protein
VLAFRSNIPAKAEVPPNASMMAAASITESCNGNRKAPQALIPKCVIYGSTVLSQSRGMLTTVELLDRLERAGVKNVEIARTLNVAASRVTEMKKGERVIKLDEAAKLVSKFQLESPPAPTRVPPLPPAVSRLLVRYVAEELGCPAPEAQLLEIAEDVRAFAEYVSDPTIRGSLEMAETFFLAMKLRRSAPA